MSDLAALNKSVSLSSASHDFVLLAKSLAVARGGISETQHLAQTVPSQRVREVLSDLKAAVAPNSLSDSSALAASRDDRGREGFIRSGTRVKSPAL